MSKFPFLVLVAIFSLLNAIPGHAQDAERVFSLKTPIEKIIATPAGRAVIDAEMPGFFAHPMYEQFKLKSIDELTVMLGGAPPERLAAIDKALRDIPVDAAKPPKAAALPAPTVDQSAEDQPAGDIPSDQEHEKE